MLRVCDLAVERGGIAILSGVTFNLSSGQTLIIRGPNGIGKTTLLRCIAGLQSARIGTVICSEDIAWAGHSDGLKAALTVRENLTFWARVYGGGGDVNKAMARFDLAPLHDRPAARPSAGQKRRLGLARLLVTGRRLWVVDEPTVSLDTTNVNRFRTVLKQHMAAGGAALISTHIDLGLADARLMDITPFRAHFMPTGTVFAEPLE